MDLATSPGGEPMIQDLQSSRSILLSLVEIERLRRLSAAGSALASRAAISRNNLCPSCRNHCQKTRAYNRDQHKRNLKASTPIETLGSGWTMHPKPYFEIRVVDTCRSERSSLFARFAVKAIRKITSPAGPGTSNVLCVSGPY